MKPKYEYSCVPIEISDSYVVFQIQTDIGIKEAHIPKHRVNIPIELDEVYVMCINEEETEFFFKPYDKPSIDTYIKALIRYN